MMGSEAEAEAVSTPRLLLFSKPNTHAYMQSPERSGMVTPPLQTSASVPFQWEEEPGKPRQWCTASSNPTDDFNPPKCLELPPRLLLLDPPTSSKLPSPTTVLEGPYMGKSKFQSFSFRVIKKDLYGSFRRNRSPPRVGTIVVSQSGDKEKGVLGSGNWGRRGRLMKEKREVGGSGNGGSYVFPASVDKESVDDGNIDEEEDDNNSITKKVNMAKITRAGSFSTVSRARPQFWASIYEGLKKVAPWRIRKL